MYIYITLHLRRPKRRIIWYWRGTKHLLTNHCCCWLIQFLREIRMVYIQKAGKQNPRKYQRFLKVINVQTVRIYYSYLRGMWFLWTTMSLKYYMAVIPVQAPGHLPDYVWMIKGILKHIRVLKHSKIFLTLNMHFLVLILNTKNIDRLSRRKLTRISVVCYIFHYLSVLYIQRLR